MNELKFNSQVCTTKEQSQRLLELGLKKETADMKIIPYSTYVVPKDYEIIIEGNKPILVKKKPKYPKTYKECCKILGYSANFNIMLTTDVDNKIFCSLYKLKVCRDAYWKIAGEQMGLGKPWKPDWCDDNKLKYCIKCSYGTPDKTLSTVNNYFLAFPTKEMRDAFKENFKKLIEQCKILL